MAAISVAGMLSMVSFLEASFTDFRVELNADPPFDFLSPLADPCGDCLMLSPPNLVMLDLFLMSFSSLSLKL